MSAPLVVATLDLHSKAAFSARIGRMPHPHAGFGFLSVIEGSDEKNVSFAVCQNCGNRWNV